MKIEVLGMGCPSCKELEKNTRQAVEELGIEAEIIKVEDVNEIVNYGVTSTPALIVNGEIKSSGRITKMEEIKQLIK